MHAFESIFTIIYKFYKKLTFYKYIYFILFNLFKILQLSIEFKKKILRVKKSIDVDNQYMMITIQYVLIVQ